MFIHGLAGAVQKALPPYGLPTALPVLRREGQAGLCRVQGSWLYWAAGGIPEVAENTVYFSPVAAINCGLYLPQK